MHACKECELFLVARTTPSPSRLGGSRANLLGYTDLVGAFVNARKAEGKFLPPPST
jgi:hypothetical protein